MDNHENDILDAEPEFAEVPTQEPEAVPESGLEQEALAEEATAQPLDEPQTTYHNAGTGRKESPFADSPYVIERKTVEYTPGYTIPAQTKSGSKSNDRIWTKILAAILVVALVGGSCATTAFFVNGYWEDRFQLLYNQIQDLEEELENNGNSVSGTAPAGDGLTPAQVFAMNDQSVVLVYNYVMSGATTGISTGSGFILTEDGYVVTNYHVIEGGSRYEVVTNNGETHNATLVGGDSNNDIAVLKIEGEFDAVTIGSSDDLIVGDQVAAIGNPLGELTSTLTVGYLSAKERYVTTEDSTSSINMMQTDCAINSGNSGGPLFNMRGEVVGITSAKYSGTSSSGATIEGISFAIPIDDVMTLIDDIMEYGYVRSAYLGVMVSTQMEPNGAYIQSVEPGYCAAEGGMQAGDIIIAVGDDDIRTMNDLTRALRRLDPGMTVTFTVLRGSQEVTLEITLDERPRENAADVEDPETAPMPSNGSYDEWYEYFDRNFGIGGNND